MPQRVDWVERHRYNPVFEEITPIDQPREDFGNVGDVHHFVTESGEQISVKTSYDEAFIWREYIGLLKVHARMGPHECVVRLRGLGKVVIDGTPRLGLLLRRVPGPSGERFFRAMDAALRDGRITSSQYWSAVQFLCDRLLSGLEHIHSADGTVHNDLLPKNFHVDATTGRPVLLDFDAWSDPANPAAIRPGMDVVGAASFAPPEASTPLAIDPRSDVYRLGATLNDLAWTRDEPMPARAPSTLSVPAGASHAPGEAAATGSRRPPLFPEFEDFLSRTMTEDKENRLTSAQARQHPFVKNRLLSDGERQALIREIAAEVRWQAPTESDLSVSHGSSEIASQDGTSNSRKTSIQVD